MLGMEDMELPRVRVRIKLATVGDLGVASVASEERRAWAPPNEGPAVLEPAVAELPKPRPRAFGWVGDSARGGGGLESNRTVLGSEAVSSCAMMMRQSRGNSRSISGSGPSWAVPVDSEAAWSG